MVDLRLVALTPPPSVLVGTIDLVATMAGWGPSGIVVTVQAVNGSVKAAATFCAAVADERAAFAAEVARVSAQAPADLLAGLVHLRPLAETCLRSQEARASQGSEDGEEEEEETPEPEPELIPLDYDPPPEFPTAVFPPWLVDLVHELARTTQTPEDLAGVLSLADLSAALGGVLRVVVKEDWAEPVNIYVVVALPPAERKSAVFSAVTAPVFAWEAVQNAERAPKVAEAESKRRILEKRLQGLEGAAAKAPPDARRSMENEAAEVRAEMAEVALVSLVQRIADDSTPEAVSKLLAEQGGRLAVMSDEGGIFDLMAGRYSADKAPNFDVFTRGHTGTRQRTNRVHRSSDHADHPALTMGLAVQPEVLVALRAIKGGMGRGLLARPLYSVPRSFVGTRESSPEPMRPEVSATFARHITTLLNVPMGTDEEGHAAAREVPFSPEGRALHVRFQDWLEPQLGPEGGLRQMGGWGGKLCGQVARLAGLLHAADWVPFAAEDPGGYLRPIPEETVERALLLGDYFLRHAKIAFAVMREDAATEGGRHILSLYRRLGMDTQLTRREVFSRTSRSVFARTAQLDAPLTFLVERGWLKCVQPKRTRGRGWAPAASYLLTAAARLALEDEVSAVSAAKVRQEKAALNMAPSTSGGDDAQGVSAVSAAGFGDNPRAHDAPTPAREAALTALTQNGAKTDDPPEVDSTKVSAADFAALKPHLPHLIVGGAELASANVARWADYLGGCKTAGDLGAQWREILRGSPWQSATDEEHVAATAVYEALGRQMREG